MNPFSQLSRSKKSRERDEPVWGRRFADNPVVSRKNPYRIGKTIFEKLFMGWRFG